MPVDSSSPWRIPWSAYGRRAPSPSARPRAALRRRSGHLARSNAMAAFALRREDRPRFCLRSSAGLPLRCECTRFRQVVSRCRNRRAAAAAERLMASAAYACSRWPTRWLGRYPFAQDAIAGTPRCALSHLPLSSSRAFRWKVPGEMDEIGGLSFLAQHSERPLVGVGIRRLLPAHVGR